MANPHVQAVLSIGNVLESAREITMEAASSASRFIDGMSADADISRLLNSTSNRDKAQGLKLALGEVARGQDARQWFADVVKNISSTDPGVRRMVYQYVVLHAAHDPDLALMAINGIQKGFQDKVPLVRVLALKTISAMAVPSIAPIVAMNVRSLAADLSPLVRSTCCRAIVKCAELDSSLKPDLLTILEPLLSDRSPEVVGSAVAALARAFPGRIEMLHKPFRKICEGMAEFNPFDQETALMLLLRYSRYYMGEEYDDVDLLLKSAQPLLHSTNASVVIAVAALFLYLRPASLEVIAPAVCRLNQTELVLQNVLALVYADPKPFGKYLYRFSLTIQDSIPAQILKLEIISQLTTGTNLGKVLNQLKFYAHTVAKEVIHAVFETIAVCATRAKAVPKINRWLIDLVSTGNPSPECVTQALVALRFLMQQDPNQTHASTLRRLVGLLDNKNLPTDARATILWLMGEYSGQHPLLACEVLRVSVANLTTYESPARLQIIQLAAKLYSHYLNDSSNQDERVPQFFQHAIHLGRYDPDYDCRDRCRMFSALLSEQQHDLATLLLQAQKPPPTIVKDTSTDYLLGSAALSVGHPLAYYVSLEDWGRRDPDLRNSMPKEPSPQLAPASISSKQATDNASHSSRPLTYTKKAPPLSLEEFLKDESEDESSDESDDTSESSEEESDSQSQEESD